MTYQKEKGLVQQMKKAGVTVAPATDVMKELSDAIFNTHEPPPSQRFLWYGPIGHIKVENGRAFVREDDEVYRPITDEERALLSKEFGL